MPGVQILVAAARGVRHRPRLGHAEPFGRGDRGHFVDSDQGDSAEQYIRRGLRPVHLQAEGNDMLLWYALRLLFLQQPPQEVDGIR